jgi:hypothetical protein
MVTPIAGAATERCQPRTQSKQQGGDLKPFFNTL